MPARNKQTKTKNASPGLLWVEIMEAEPNPLFTEEERQTVRFLKYTKAVACAECGKSEKLHWTMLCEFHCVAGERRFKPSQKKHSPLTAVCAKHPIKAALP